MQGIFQCPALDSFGFLPLGDVVQHCQTARNTPTPVQQWLYVQIVDPRLVPIRYHHLALTAALLQAALGQSWDAGQSLTGRLANRSRLGHVEQVHGGPVEVNNQVLRVEHDHGVAHVFHDEIARHRYYVEQAEAQETPGYQQAGRREAKGRGIQSHVGQLLAAT